MANTTPSYEYFNVSVKGWARDVRRTLAKQAREAPKHNTKESENRKTPKLAKSISVGFKKSYGAISQISFSFARHGLFIHYGVGRGYILEGNKVKYGRRLQGDEVGRLLNRGYSRKEIAKMRFRYKDEGENKREPIDWFDVEIRKGMKWLAEYAGDFYGEKAMNAIVEQIEKPLPIFTKYVKIKPKE